MRLQAGPADANTPFSREFRRICARAVGRRRLIWQLLREPRLGQQDLKNVPRDGRTRMLLSVCATVFDCSQDCCRGCSQLPTNDDWPGTSPQKTATPGHNWTVRPWLPITGSCPYVPMGRSVMDCHGHSLTDRQACRAGSQHVAAMAEHPW